MNSYSTGFRHNRRLQFDSDYDIQRANEQFQRTLNQNTVVKSMDELKKDEFFGGKSDVFYDRQKSFFDNISCETREKLEGKIGQSVGLDRLIEHFILVCRQNVRPDWKKERIINQETFGFHYWGPPKTVRPDWKKESNRSNRPDNYGRMIYWGPQQHGVYGRFPNRPQDNYGRVYYCGPQQQAVYGRYN